MYKLSRLLLMMTALLYWYCLAIALIAALQWLGTWPLLILLGLWLGKLLRGKVQRLTAMGTAHWAEEKDLERAGMLGGNRGLILGRVPEAGNRTRQRMKALFNRRLSAKEACKEYLNG